MSGVDFGGWTNAGLGVWKLPNLGDGSTAVTLLLPTNLEGLGAQVKVTTSASGYPMTADQARGLATILEEHKRLVGRLYRGHDL